MVLIAMAEYYNRMSLITNNKDVRIFGGLLGQVTDKRADILYSFELLNTSNTPNKVEIDLKYLEERRRLVEQQFKNYELLGFYTISSDTLPRNEDKAVFEALKTVGVISPFYLVMSYNLEGQSILPVSVYEINKLNGQFLKIKHEFEGLDSERICLDTVTNFTDFQDSESAMIQNMNTTKNAVNMLKENLCLIKQSFDDPKFNNDPVYLALLDEIVRNFPEVRNKDSLNMMNYGIGEIGMLNNICASTTSLNYQGRLEGKVLKGDIGEEGMNRGMRGHKMGMY
jgi:hypothetical protein